MSEMQYFVSIENNAYCRWQTELLIESFKYHNLQDNLVIAIAHNEENDIPNFTKNISAHTNKFVHENLGQKCKSFNKTRSLIMALENGLLKKPFVLLHSDMLLFNPMTIKQNFVYDINTSDLDEIKNLLSNRIKESLQKKDGWFAWIPLGHTMIFDEKIPDSFFIAMHRTLESLLKEFGNLKLLERAAWLLTIYKELIFNEEELSISGDYLEQDLLAHNVHRNIIHYKHGIAEFHKCHYTYRPPEFWALDGQDPLDSLYANNFTTSTNFAYDLVEKYRNV